MPPRCPNRGVRRLPPLTALLAVLLAVACARDPAPLTVHAAASLMDVLAPDETASFNFAGTARLARQIEAGVPGDVFVSADREWMDHVESRGLVVPGTATLVARNRLVLVVPGSAKADLTPADLAAGSSLRVALAEAAVPAGRYAEAALRGAGVWDALEGRIVRAPHVRATLAWAARGEVDAAVVYATDAAAEPGVRQTHVFPEQHHPPIEYWAAVLASTTSEAAAREMVRRLADDERRWTATGFIPARGGEP